MGRYIAARRITSLTIIVGWLFAVLGGTGTVAGLFYALAALSGSFVAVSLGIGFPISIGVCVAGLVLVLCSWVARAVFDMAEQLQSAN